MKKTPRVCLVGIGGYARVHLAHLMDFHLRGLLQLGAVVAFPPEPDVTITQTLTKMGVRFFSSFEELVTALPHLRLDLGIVPTPIHLHARMTITLLEAGLDVLVEKPIASDPADVDRIIAASHKTGRNVTVGFQYLHAPEITALKQLLLSGEIGPLKRIVVHAAWPRSHAYYTRNTWVGRVRMNNDWVLDSPLNNAMSHFVMLMFYLAGREMDALAEPTTLTAELYRAQKIESFDTAAVHWETPDGCLLEFYGTHSSREIGRPSLAIFGESGRADWVQDSHALVVGRNGNHEYRAVGEPAVRENMLHAVLARIRGEHVFTCRPELAGTHVRSVATLHAHVPIIDIPSENIAIRHIKGDDFTFVPGLDELLAGAAILGRNLKEAGARWGTTPTRVSLIAPSQGQSHVPRTPSA